MSEPFAQFGARRNVLHPFVVAQVLLADAAGPDPVDQEPCLRVSVPLIVDARDPDLGPPTHVFSASSIRSSALIEWANAAPARISAATQMASMICSAEAPSRLAAFTCPSMHQGHWVT